MIPGKLEQTFYSVKDVAAQDFIKGYADFLKKNNKLEIPKVINLNHQERKKYTYICKQVGWI
jgi:ribosomal protein S19E (S16A)